MGNLQEGRGLAGNGVHQILYHVWAASLPLFFPWACASNLTSAGPKTCCRAGGLQKCKEILIPFPLQSLLVRPTGGYSPRLFGLAAPAEDEEG